MTILDSMAINGRSYLHTTSAQIMAIDRSLGGGRSPEAILRKFDWNFNRVISNSVDDFLWAYSATEAQLQQCFGRRIDSRTIVDFGYTQANQISFGDYISTRAWLDGICFGIYGLVFPIAPNPKATDVDAKMGWAEKRKIFAYSDFLGNGWSIELKCNASASLFTHFKIPSIDDIVKELAGVSDNMDAQAVADWNWRYLHPSRKDLREEMIASVADIKDPKVRIVLCHFGGFGYIKDENRTSVYSSKYCLTPGKILISEVPYEKMVSGKVEIWNRDPTFAVDFEEGDLSGGIKCQVSDSNEYDLAIREVMPSQEEYKERLRMLFPEDFLNKDVIYLDRGKK